MARPLLAALLSASIVVGAPLPASLAVAAEEDPVAVARELYDRGSAKYETADYEGAIDLWTDAYARLPTNPETLDIKVLILYNLASAREKAFEVDGKISHLRQAMVLLEGFEASIPAIYGEGETADAELARVAERKAAIKARLEAEEAKNKPKDPPKDDGTTPPKDPPPNLPSGRGQIITGAAFLGVGVASLGVMATGLALGSAANDVSGLDPADIDGRHDQFARGRTGNVLAIAGMSLAAPMIAVGAVFLGLGLRKEKRRRAAEGPRASAAPVAAPGYAGLMLRGRF